MSQKKKFIDADDSTQQATVDDSERSQESTQVIPEPITPAPTITAPLVDAPRTVSALNRSPNLLTIRSRGSIPFPPGATEEISEEEAELWLKEGWVTIKKRGKQ